MYFRFDSSLCHALFLQEAKMFTFTFDIKVRDNWRAAQPDYQILHALKDFSTEVVHYLNYSETNISQHTSGKTGDYSSATVRPGRIGVRF